MSEEINFIEPNGAEPQSAQLPEPEKIEPSLELNDLEDKSVEELKEIEKKLKNDAREDNVEEEVSEETDSPKAKEPEREENKEVKRDVEKELKDAQSYIGRQSNVIGEKNKENAELRRRIAELEERALNPQKAEAESEEEKAKIAAMMLEDPERAIAYVEQKKQQKEFVRRQEIEKRDSWLKEKAPDLNEYGMDMVKILTDRDGLSPQQVKEIADNLDKVSPLDVYHLYDRARMARENQRLQAEIEKLKNLPNKIAEASRGQSIITRTASAAPGTSKKYTDAELDAMSPAELKKLENELKRKG